MREIWFVTLFVLALTGALPAAAQAPPAGSNVAAGELLSPTKGDRVLGKPEAPITIIEYASLSCPHCAHFAKDVLPKLKEKWLDSGKAKLILRDFPLDPPALRAAMIVRCVAPEKFYPLVDMFFDTQDKWVVEGDPRAALERLSLLSGIGKKEFDACYNNKALEDQVAQSRLTASQQLNVAATPTFFINGKVFPGAPTLEEIDKMLSGLAEKS